MLTMAMATARTKVVPMIPRSQFGPSVSLKSSTSPTVVSHPLGEDRVQDLRIAAADSENGSAISPACLGWTDILAQE